MNRHIQISPIHYIGPIVCIGNQSRPDWILPNVRLLPDRTSIVAKTVIEKVSLPNNACEFIRSSLEISDRLCKGLIPIIEMSACR